MTLSDVPLPDSDGATGSKNGRGIRVLLAEDDRAVRRLMEVLLERAGYEVIAASDGLEAMKLALSSPINLLITDAMMPNLNGHELCRFMRNSETLSHIPIILLSALEKQGSDGQVQNADAFLTKPVSSESLIECIEKLLARR